MSIFRFPAVLLTCVGGLLGSVVAADKPVAEQLNHTAAVSAVQFSADGKQVISLSDAEALTWEIAGGKVTAKVKWVGGTVAAVTPDGKTAAFTSTNRANLLVTIRPIEEGKNGSTIDPKGDVVERTVFGSLVVGMLFADDGKKLVTVGRNGLVGGSHGLPGGVIQVWETATAKRLALFNGPRPGVSTSAMIGSIGVSGNGKFLAVGTDGAGGELPESGRVIVWNFATERIVQDIAVRQGVKPGEFHSAVTAVAIAHDGKQVAGSFGNRPPRADGLVLGDPPTVECRIWDVESGKEIRALTGHRAPITSLAYAPKGNRLVSADHAGVIRVWAADKGEQTHSFQWEGGRIRSIAWSPDGERLAVGGSRENGGAVRVWSVGK